MESSGKMHYILETIDKLHINVKFHVCLRQYQLGNCCHCENVIERFLQSWQKVRIPMTTDLMYQEI